jgi:PhoH-like ATPase
MKKKYVLDTNVLLHDPQAIFKFEDNEVFIPVYVIEEVDRFKRESTERGRNARTVSRLLDGLRDNGGCLSRGIELDEGGRLTVYVPERKPELAAALHPSSPDHVILQCAMELRDADLATPTIFITMDVNLRIRADAYGLSTEQYENQAVEFDQLYTGNVELTVPGENLDAFFTEGLLAVPGGLTLDPNACVTLRATSGHPRTGLARFDAERGVLVALITPRSGIMGIRPRNREQTFALDLLLTDQIRLVTLVGKAGTGKTLLALAAGLHRTFEDGGYSRLLVSRPVMPLGRDIGFLPGDIEQKLNPWMQPVFDNLEYLLLAGGARRPGMRTPEELLASGQMQIEPLTYIRGRSLPQQYVIVDEAQNLTPHEVKTIITRCGDGTKIVLTGDPHQIDNPYVDSATNGLTVVAERLRDEPLTAHIVLAKGERSELANVAANRL